MTHIEKSCCSFCGVERMCAAWMGHKINVRCCSVCAEKDLPRLLADAVHLAGPDNTYEQARKAWDRSEGAFWKAIASRLSYGKTV